MIILTFVIGAQAQDIDYDYDYDYDYEAYAELESNRDLKLSSQQIARIKKLNREVGPKFQAIGRSNLSGYEKGQRKRALAFEHRQAIRDILTENQADMWERRYDDRRYEGRRWHGDLRDDIKDDYEIRLKRLERKYEADKDRIEDSLLPKYERKARLKSLKRKYKAQKEQIKDERDRHLRSGVFYK